MIALAVIATELQSGAYRPPYFNSIVRLAAVDVLFTEIAEYVMHLNKVSNNWTLHASYNYFSSIIHLALPKITRNYQTIEAPS